MKEIMMTSGSGFEGYEVTEYLGIVNGQTVIGSNFFKGIAAGVTEMSDVESEKLTFKLEQVNETAMERLKSNALAKKADAIIGVGFSYSQFANNAVGAVAHGTAVKLSRKVREEHGISNELFVSNYYNSVVPRPVKVILSGNREGINISTWYYNYNNVDIKAIRVDIELTNQFNEKLIMKNIDFVFQKGNLNLIKSNKIECKLQHKDVPMIKKVNVYVSKYVTSDGICVVEDNPIEIEMSSQRLSALKGKRGIDAVKKYKTDGMIWHCNCGYVNEAGSEECIICSRKQEDIREKTKFNPERMIARMKSKEKVTEIKDILMEYIKEIDSKLRMVLLEIMESGIQYEKTNKNMKDSVIEKVEKVFEQQ